MTNRQSMDEPPNPRRRLPSVSRLLTSPPVIAEAGHIPGTIITAAARAVLDDVRAQLAGDPGAQPPAEPEIARRVAQAALRLHAPSLSGAINATGVVLHTGLGRARLCDDAVRAIAEVARDHSLVEIDRDTGRRGSRRDHVRSLLCELTGAEDATIVNNCAGAVFLAVTVLAAGREVIISRGELVEIGGAFRMPDIVRASGAVLVEVGTTNRTRIGDYAGAITERTGLLLRCHPSNFAIVGFTEAATTEALAALGAERGIPVMDDQGNGALVDPLRLGLAMSKGSLRHSVEAGCDVVTASGDKLLGGPQAGVILGRREIVERIARHPLARALRVDKLTVAGLEATLRLYRDPNKALAAIPTLRYLTRSEAELRQLAERLQQLLAAALPPGRFTIELVPERSQVGGGSLPDEDLPTVCVRVRAFAGTPSAEEIATTLRHHTPPIFARIHQDALLLDPRALEPGELHVISDAAVGLVEAERQKVAGWTE